MFFYSKNSVLQWNHKIHWKPTKYRHLSWINCLYTWYTKSPRNIFTSHELNYRLKDSVKRIPHTICILLGFIFYSHQNSSDLLLIITNFFLQCPSQLSNIWWEDFFHALLIIDRVFCYQPNWWNITDLENLKHSKINLSYAILSARSTTCNVLEYEYDSEKLSWTASCNLIKWQVIGDWGFHS